MWLVVIVGVALVAVAATGVWAYAQRQEVLRLRTELADAHARIAELETRLAEVERQRGPGGLDRLLDELFGGDGGLGGLRERGLEGLLDGLLDGLLGGLGGREDLLGGISGSFLADCLAGGALELRSGEPITAADRDTQVEAITERVEDLRRLEFVTPVEPQLLPGDVFSARVTELVADHYSTADADTDRRVLGALGAVEPDADLRSLLVDAVGEQAGGFYSPETGDLAVRVSDPYGPLRPAERIILAHEMQHAAADQHFRLPIGDDAPEDADAARAALALVEGDATLLMHQFMVDALTLTDQLGMFLDPSAAGGVTSLSGYPEYVRRELVFPYIEGMGFVCGLYGDGGWPAVDAAYADPPTTTSQVLWPERYGAGEDAVATARLGNPGGSWTRAHTDTFGAAELLWLFSAPGDDTGAALDAPMQRAAAWAGGNLALWTDGDDSAVGVTLSQRPGERPLCSSVTGWYTAAFPDARPVRARGSEALAVTGPVQDAVVVCDDDSVRVGIAPDLATARAVAR